MTWQSCSAAQEIPRACELLCARNSKGMRVASWDNCLVVSDGGPSHKDGRHRLPGLGNAAMAMAWQCQVMVFINANSLY